MSGAAPGESEGGDLVVSVKHGARLQDVTIPDDMTLGAFKSTLEEAFGVPVER